MARLDLSRYHKPAPLNNERVKMDNVKLLLSQHIGAPALSCVSKGDIVTTGQVIAKPAEGLSVAIHASIDGKVMAVTDKYVIIKNQEGCI